MTRAGRSRLRGVDRRVIRSSVIALVSTVVFFGALAVAVRESPGWPAVRTSFLDGPLFAESLPKVVDQFAVNIQMFLVAEVLVLVLGLGLAILRSLPGPVFFPIRLIATVYTDIFRAIPGLVVVSVLGYGIPTLGFLDPKTPKIWYGIAALTLVYSAYVSEVYRAGIESIHPSQEAAARSLGLSRSQAMRHVIVPQAVRRVIPPLLNDFIGLQKDTVLVSSIGLVEIFRETQIMQSANFNFTPYMALALVFVVVTIPLARLTDWLIARDRRSQAAGGVR